MAVYSLEFATKLWKGTRSNEYQGDAYARSAAMRIFANRAHDAGDELYVYEGNLEYGGFDNCRYIGKVAFLADGETIGWFKPNPS